MISIIKSFEDLSSIVIKKDGYLNVYSVISITKKLIKEMIVHITTKYSPENIEELKDELYNNVLTKNMRYYVDDIRFYNLMVCYNDMIDNLELNKNKSSIKISDPLMSEYKIYNTI